MALRLNQHQALGSDGNDFQHRQQILNHYQISAMTKSRLRYCIFFHYLLSLFMFAKLSPDILDKADIFILSIEELRVPQPLWWEYIWLLSLIFAFLVIPGIRRNDIKKMQQVVIGITLLGFGPLIYAFIYYFQDVWRYLKTGEKTEIEIWQDMPYGLLWYIFIVLAAQVHGFTLFFSWTIMVAWRQRGNRRRD